MSQPITITVPHQLGVAEAKRRIEQGFGQLQGQIAGKGLAQVHKTWDGDAMSFSAQMMGQALRGRLRVAAEAVHMEIELPPLLAMVANAIKGRLQKQGQILLEKK